MFFLFYLLKDMNIFKECFFYSILRSIRKSNPISPFTVNPVYNEHLRDPEFLTAVDKWSLFRGSFMSWKAKMGPQHCGCYSEIVVNLALTVFYFWSIKYQNALKLNSVINQYVLHASKIVHMIFCSPGQRQEATNRRMTRQLFQAVNVEIVAKASAM